jgi:galactokinase
MEALLGLHLTTRAAAATSEAKTNAEAEAVVKALRCVEAEHVYAGVPCGVMDQIVSAAGLKDNVLLIDCRTDTVTHVPFVDENMSIVVCNSNVKHSLDGSEYPTRVKQVWNPSQELCVLVLFCHKTNGTHRKKNDWVSQTSSLWDNLLNGTHVVHNGISLENL